MFLTKLQKIINAGGLIYPSLLAAPSASYAIVEPSAEQPAEAETTDAAERALEKTRLKEILSCDEAKGREALAQHLAVSTDVTPIEARAILSASARERSAAPSAKPDPFAKALWTEPEPQRDDAGTQIRRMQAAYSHVTGEPIARKA